MNAHPLAGVRTEILSLVATTPGITPAEVARLLSFDHSTAAYHLRRLAKARLVRPVDAGRHLRYFAIGCEVCPFLREVMPLLRDARYGDLLATVEQGPRSVATLATDPQAAARVRARLERLERVGLLSREHGVWAPTPETGVCRTRARLDGSCGLWGRCEVSARWTGPPSVNT